MKASCFTPGSRGGEVLAKGAAKGTHIAQQADKVVQATEKAEKVVQETSKAAQTAEEVKAGGTAANDAQDVGRAEAGSGSGGTSTAAGGGGGGGPGKNFDKARREAFEKAGMTDASKVEISKYDPATGTAVEFKGPGGAKVGYDAPHASPGPHHDVQHIGWQSGGKRGAGGAQRGNIPYSGPEHPSRPPRKAD